MAGSSGGGLFDTIVKLVNLGFAGVGVVVLLLLFVILIRDQPANAATQKLRNRFLTWGMSFAFFCGVLAFAGPLLAPKAIVAKPPEMMLAFSPSFTTEGLTKPEILVPGNLKVDPEQNFTARNGTVLVRVDAALKDVATLKETALTLAKAATDAQKQADQAVAELAKAQGQASSPPVAAAQDAVKDASNASQVATTAIADAIKTGQFQKLEVTRKTLDVKTTASIRARDRFIRQIGQ